MEKCYIFYSWQSDLPNNTNRTFIEGALEKAIKLLVADKTVEIEPVLDRDTLNEPGAIHIAESVFSKIDKSKVFVGDVSIIGVVPVSDSPGKERPTPNPNVLVELGYALKTLRHTGVLMVMNTAFGEIKDLPFDLDRRRVIPYALTSSEPNKSAVRTDLSKILAARIKEIIEHDVSNELPEEVKLLTVRLADAYAAAAEPYSVKRVLNEEADAVIEKLNDLPVLKKDELLTTPELTDFLRRTFELSEELIRAFAFGCYEGNARYDNIWAEILTRIGERVAPARKIDELRCYPTLLCFYAAGITAVAGEKYETLASLIHKTKLRASRGHSNSPQTPAYLLIPARVIDRDEAKKIPQIGRFYTPINQYLYRILREPLREVILNDEAYDDAFLRFEYLFALVAMDIYHEKVSSFVVPEGSYGWKNWITRDSAFDRSYIWNLTTQELETEGDNWQPLLSGVFKMTLDRGHSCVPS